MTSLDVGPWTAELVSLLEGDGTASVVQAPQQGQAGFDLHLTLKDGALGATFLKSPSVTKHLCAWPRSEDLVVWAAPAGGSSTPLILIRDRRLLVVSGPPPQQKRARSFDEWFRDLTGSPFPVDLGPLAELSENLYGPQGDVKEDYRQLNWGLLRRGWSKANPLPYAAVSFSGYGSNSYAIYVTRVLARTRMVLRLAHGGVYLDPSTSVPQLLADLVGAVRLQDRAAANGAPLFLNHNMGDWSFTFEELELQPHNGFPTNRLQSADTLREIAAAIPAVKVS